MSEHNAFEVFMGKLDHTVDGSPPPPPAKPPIFAGGGGPPHNDDMEARVIKLEEFAQDTRDRLTRIETKLDSTATKAEMHDLKAEMIKWIVGTAIGLGVAAITVMTFVLNNAAPKVLSTSSQPPIIINVPAAPATPPAPSSKP